MARGHRSVKLNPAIGISATRRIRIARPLHLDIPWQSGGRPGNSGIGLAARPGDRRTRVGGSNPLARGHGEGLDFMDLFNGGFETIRRIRVGSRQDTESSDSVYPFAQALDAWHHFDTRKNFGKVIITM
jgi:hypothetical protein